MKARCLSPSKRRNKHYANITIDGRWLSFENFLADMGACPDGGTIDRIDNEQGYMPSNCRWATPVEQANNHRNNRILKIGSASMTLAEASRRYGVKSHTIAARLRNGFTMDEALSTQRLKPRFTRHSQSPS